MAILMAGQRGSWSPDCLAVASHLRFDSQSPNHVRSLDFSEVRMTLARVVTVVGIIVSVGCGGGSGAPGGSGGGGSAPDGKFVEGKDYVVLERVRLLDSQGFDKPVEAMSLLAPRGWKTDGGVTWRGFNECRGEMVTWRVSSVSPDSAIRIDIPPTRTFVWSEDAMLRQTNLKAAQAGGCAVHEPFDATTYLQAIAHDELGGATVTDVRTDESLMALIAKFVQMSDETARQFGTGMQSSGTGIYANLKFPDGTEGLANIGVTMVKKDSRDMFTGRPNGFSSTSVFHRVIVRFPADRREEALRLFGTTLSSYRINPAWQQAKDQFMTKLGNIEHRGNMDRIRMMGEQSAAYAKARSDAQEDSMRNWEQQNAASDASQHRFIQTIREVETWKDSTGNPVELSAGYHHGWSRPDGSYILTNNSNFDPAVVFQQNWTKMEKKK
jgi:hypothetical protein